jgi:hypothetical protein
MALVATLSGCSAKTSANPPTAAGPQVETAAATADKIMRLTSYQQWSQLYAYLHPDIQAKFTQQQFIDERTKSGGGTALITNYSIDSADAVTLPTWTDSKGSGNTYQNVAEVPVKVTMGSINVNTTIHLAKAPDGTWRYFWWPEK